MTTEMAQINLVADAVKANPGRTSREISSYAAIDRFQVARLLPQAEKREQCVRGAPRVCSISKRIVLTWWPK